MYTHWIVLRFDDRCLLIETVNRVRIVERLMRVMGVKVNFVRDVKRVRYVGVEEIVGKVMRKPMVGMTRMLLRVHNSHGFEVELEKQIEGTISTFKYFSILTSNMLIMFSTADFGHVRLIIPLLETTLIKEEGQRIVLEYP